MLISQSGSKFIGLIRPIDGERFSDYEIGRTTTTTTPINKSYRT